MWKPENRFWVSSIIIGVHEFWISDALVFRFWDCIGSHISVCCYHDWSHNSAVLQTEVSGFRRYTKVSGYYSIYSIINLLSLFPRHNHKSGQ